jgi:hypothetical protein
VKDKDREHLKLAAIQCDRAIVRLTMKEPNKTTLEDVGYLASSLATARDALTWAAEHGKRSPRAKDQKR